MVRGGGLTGGLLVRAKRCLQGGAREAAEGGDGPAEIVLPSNDAISATIQTFFR